MISRLLASAAAIVAFALPITSSAETATWDHSRYDSNANYSTSSLHEYSTPAAAQRHCPTDTVVWLNTNSGIYHEAGMRWYGHTRHGAYVCRREANRAGDRDTRNGQ